MKIAKKLIEASKNVGADCVKFQSWSKESIYFQKNMKIIFSMMTIETGKILH